MGSASLSLDDPKAGRRKGVLEAYIRRKVAGSRAGILNSTATHCSRQETDAGETTGIDCLPELVLREERSGELLWMIRWRLEIQTVEGALQQLAGGKMAENAEGRRRRRATGWAAGRKKEKKKKKWRRKGETG